MVKGCNCISCRAARALGNFKIAKGWKESDPEKDDKRDNMFDWDNLKDKLKCCACNKPMLESEYVNGIMLNKYATWKYPAWGNILAVDDDKKQLNRASAIICDTCLELKKKPKYAVELRFKNGVVDEVIYHKIDELKDADPITEEDLEE